MEIEDANMNSIHFDSPIDILEYDVSSIHKNNLRRFNSYKIQHLGDRSVPTCPRADQIIDMAINGDNILYQQFVMPKIEELNNKIRSENIFDFEHKIQVRKRKRIKSSFGNEIDIHKVYQGRINEAWDSTKTIVEESDKRFITICVYIGQNWNVLGLPSIWTTAVCLKIVDELELAGKNVQIIVCKTLQTAVKEKRFTTTSCLIKRYNERISIERLAAMTHLGFSRSFMWCAILTSKYEINEGLGVSKKVNSGQFDLLPKGIRDDSKLGKTKPIIISQSLSLYESIQSLREAYYQLGKK